MTPSDVSSSASCARGCDSPSATGPADRLRTPGCRQGHPGGPPGRSATASRTSPPATCSAPRSRTAPSSACGPRRSWTPVQLAVRRRDAGLVSERLAQPDAAPGWLLDGFPRTLPARPRTSTSSSRDGGIDLAIDLDVPEDVVVERISSRRVCEECGTIYGPSSDSGRLRPVRRTDGAARRRHRGGGPRAAGPLRRDDLAVVAWFAERGDLVRIDGVGAPDDVAPRLHAAIEARVG